MIRKDEVRLFLKREIEQGRHLQRALKGHHQEIFLHPSNEVKRLKPHHRWFLGAFNGYARALWFRALGGRLSQHLGARPGVWVPDQPVYFLTLIDQELAWDSDDGNLREQLRKRGRASTSIARAAKRFSSVTGGLNCLGMIDVSPYVSSVGALRMGFHGSHVYLPHFHGLVWGCSEEEIEWKCAFIRKKMKTFFKYATSVQYQLVNPDDLAQVVWYTTKTPRKQYQLWRRADEHVRQFKRAINGVNAVRLYAEMRDVTLDQLVVANRRGAQVLAAAMKDIRRVTARAERAEDLPDCGWYQNRPPVIMPMRQVITLEEYLRILDFWILSGR